MCRGRSPIRTTRTSPCPFVDRELPTATPRARGRCRRVACRAHDGGGYGGRGAARLFHRAGWGRKTATCEPGHRPRRSRGTVPSLASLGKHACDGDGAISQSANRRRAQSASAVSWATPISPASTYAIRGRAAHRAQALRESGLPARLSASALTWIGTPSSRGRRSKATWGDARGPSAEAAASAWGEIVGDEITAAAMIDRLVHHAEILALKR